MLKASIIKFEKSRIQLGGHCLLSQSYQIVSSKEVFSSNSWSTSWSAYQARFSKIVSNMIIITQTVILTQMFNIIKDKKNSMCFRYMS